MTEPERANHAKQLALMDANLAEWDRLRPHVPASMLSEFEARVAAMKEGRQIYAGRSPDHDD